MQQYLDLYTSQRQALCSHSATVMNALRDEALAAFRTAGFPTKKVERYRYTDIAPLFAPDYGLNILRLPLHDDPCEAFRCDVLIGNRHPYYIVNDTLQGGHEQHDVIVCPLTEAARDYPDIVGRHYGKAASVSGDSITALNTMLAQDGLFVYVPKNVCAEHDIQIINLLHSDVDLMVNRRVLIVVEEGAQVKLLFCDHAADDRHFLTTQVTEAFIGRGATLDLYSMEETHAKNVCVNNLYIRQAAASRAYHNIITLHNGITRNRTDLTLEGPGAECELCGCVVADKVQHVDNNTLIEHKAPHCTSHELYKYVLDDKATGAFAGRVLVDREAQHTVSDEVNRNITTTRQARMFTQPMLEIYADDVKCSHGSTVGQLNDAALFYMRQRGISLKEAKVMLETAFVGEVIDRIRIASLRERLHYLLDRRFHGELNKCAGCKLCQ